MTMKQFKQVISSLFIVFALLVATDVSAKTTYFVNDHLGSVVAALDENGEVLYREGYYPFGERLVKEENEHSQWFTGKRHDEELGLSYFGARWYDPVVGRFTGIDAVGVQEANIHTFNRYAYAANNPAKYVDPDGDFFFLAPLVIFIAKEVAGEVVAQTTGFDGLSVRRLVTKGAKKVIKKVKGSCCFVAGTQVLTRDGYKAIEAVELGEFLWSTNVETGASDWKPVTKLFKEPNRRIYELVFEDQEGNGITIEATDDHPFWVDKNWVQVKDLKVGQLTETKNSGLLKLKSWNETNRYELTYNFTVDDFHTYYVTQFDVLVHNCNGTAKDASKAKRRAAREAQRQHGTPTSRPGTNQQGTPGTPRHQIKEGSDGKPDGVVDGSNDTVAGHGPHIEAGDLKAHDPINRYGQPRLRNGKSKVEY
jgi:RHS repeat-associated protein